MIRRLLALFVALFIAGVSRAFSPTAIVISPTTFDFGWCPDNAKINAEFVIRNTGTDLVPLTGVQPTCGCTASQFTPGTLGSNDESKVVLTFNTRGYAGSLFRKSAQVKTDTSAVEYTVSMTGHVLNPAAPVAPTGDGIAEFATGSQEKQKTISIQNKSGKDVTLKVVQPAAAWANVKFDVTSMKAGQTAAMTVAPDGGFDQERTTSITVEANDGTTPSRFTVAIRTGTPPPAMRRPAAGPAATSPAKK